MAGALQVGQRLLSTTAVGGIAGGAYGAFQASNGDYSADWRESAVMGAKIGLGVGVVGNLGSIKDLARDSFNAAGTMAMKTSMFTEAMNKQGLTGYQARLMGSGKIT